MTRQILVGGVPIGGGAPVVIQSMLNTKTTDIAASLEQLRQLTPLQRRESPLFSGFFDSIWKELELT